MLESLTATLYLSCYWLFHRIHAGSQALFEGFWLGLLPDSVVDLISQRSYKGGHQYTDSDYLDSGFFFWEKIAVNGFFSPGGRVLVASAGGGRELIALARTGYTATGFECCAPMVSAGNQALSARGIDSRIEWAPPCKIPEVSGIYDGAIIGWNGYTYISPPERRIAFLRSLLPYLCPGSPVLVSAAIRPATVGGSAIWTPRIANVVRTLTFRAPVFTAGATFPGRPRHQFTRDQLAAELRDAGYTPAAFWTWGVFGAVVCLKGPGATSRSASGSVVRTET